MYKNQYFNIFNLLENDVILISKYNLEMFLRIICTFYNQIAFKIQSVYNNERMNSKLEV